MKIFDLLMSMFTPQVEEENEDIDFTQRPINVDAEFEEFRRELEGRERRKVK